MWIFTTQGFYSAVEHREDADKLIVRPGHYARVWSELYGLQREEQD